MKVNPESRRKLVYEHQSPEWKNDTPEFEVDLPGAYVNFRLNRNSHKWEVYMVSDIEGKKDKFHSLDSMSKIKGETIIAFLQRCEEIIAKGDIESEESVAATRQEGAST